MSSWPGNNEAAHFYFWEYINLNQTFMLDYHWPFICSARTNGTSGCCPLLAPAAAAHYWRKRLLPLAPAAAGRHWRQMRMPTTIISMQLRPTTGASGCCPQLALAAAPRWRQQLLPVTGSSK
jgi:hypothetical protein